MTAVNLSIIESSEVRDEQRIDRVLFDFLSNKRKKITSLSLLEVGWASTGISLIGLNIISPLVSASVFTKDDYNTLVLIGGFLGTSIPILAVKILEFRKGWKQVYDSSFEGQAVKYKKLYSESEEENKRIRQVFEEENKRIRQFFEGRIVDMIAQAKIEREQGQAAFEAIASRLHSIEGSTKAIAGSTKAITEHLENTSPVSQTVTQSSVTIETRETHPNLSGPVT